MIFISLGDGGCFLSKTMLNGYCVLLSTREASQAIVKTLNYS